MASIRWEWRVPSISRTSAGRSGFAEDARADGVADVVREVGDSVGHSHDLGLKGELAEFRRVQEVSSRFRVMENGLPCFSGEVEARAVLLKDVHRPQALLVMPEPSWEQTVEHHLSDVAERRMPDIVAERGGFHQVLVEAERPGRTVRAIWVTSSVWVRRVTK